MSHAKYPPILSALEQKYYYGHPQFTDNEHLFFFFLSKKEKNLLKGKSKKSIIYVILQLGYFKAKHQFFDVDNHMAQQDIIFIQKEHFASNNFITINLSRNTKNVIEKDIANFLGYEIRKKKIVETLTKKITQLVRLHNDSRWLFQELRHILFSNKMIFPAYSTLQMIVGSAMNQEKNRLMGLITQGEHSRDG